jgi:hypothetical protein
LGDALDEALGLEPAQVCSAVCSLGSCVLMACLKHGSILCVHQG